MNTEKIWKIVREVVSDILIVALIFIALRIPSTLDFGNPDGFIGRLVAFGAAAVLLLQFIISFFDRSSKVDVYNQKLNDIHTEMLNVNVPDNFKAAIDINLPGMMALINPFSRKIFGKAEENEFSYNAKEIFYSNKDQKKFSEAIGDIARWFIVTDGNPDIEASRKNLYESVSLENGEVTVKLNPSLSQDEMHYLVASFAQTLDSMGRGLK